jgi:hypothetical protein
MRVHRIIAVSALFASVLLLAQDSATVRIDKPAPFRPGGPVGFDLTLDEPLPSGAHFDFRISPTAADEQISLGSGRPLDDSGKHFRISGTLPEGALPGEWHVSVIWLFLPGTGWTQNSIATNNLKFQVEGRPYAIPTKGEVKIAK